MSFDLSNVISAASEFKPQRSLVYGVPGIGKTVFGCTFEKPILLRVEDGAAAIDVATFPKLIENYAELMEALSALHGQEHDFKTLVLDSLDWLEPIVWAQTVTRLNADRDRPLESIEGVGYGKGYVEAEQEWRNVLGWLDALRLNRGMAIVLIAHAEIKRHEPPDGDPFDRYQIKLHKRAWALWQEWADMVLFANYRKRTIKTKDGGKSGQDKFRAEGAGERCLYTDERPAYVAKNHWSLPHEIFVGQDKTWRPFHEALNQATGGKYALPSTLNSKEAA